jgi:hypothetical protein
MSVVIDVDYLTANNLLDSAKQKRNFIMALNFT